MKTNELIKLLQEEDPNNECHVRFGGAIVGVERKEGYWDGPYSYINDKKQFVISTRDDKIDIHCTDVEDFIWDHDGDYSDVIFDFEGYSREALENKKESYLKTFKKSSDEFKRLDKQLKEQFFFEVVEKLQKGWKIREDKDKGKWNKVQMNFVNKIGIRAGQLCIGEMSVVYDTGMFEVYDEEKNSRFWRLK